MSKEWIDLLSQWLEADEDIESELADVQLVPVGSSNLAAVGYNKDRFELVIAFIDGSIYRYYGVSRQRYTALMRAPSHGQYFVQNIRLSYPYERIVG